MANSDRNTVFQTLASGFAELLVEERVPTGLSASKSTQKELFKNKILKELEIFNQQLVDGVFHLLNKISFTPDIASDLEKLAQYSQSLHIQERKELYIKALTEGSSLQQLCGITEETLEHLYKAAKALYDQKDFQAARAAFTFLTLLDHFRYAFWLGLATSTMYCHAFDSALTAFAFAIQMNPADPICHIYSSHCYDELNQLDNAINALDLALVAIDKNSAYADWKKRVQEEKMRLTRKQKN